MSKSLVELFREKTYLTDKGDCGGAGAWSYGPPCGRCSTNYGGKGHHYLEFYDLLFSRLKIEAENVVEIGIGAGGSIKLWHDFFPKAKITGVDKQVSSETANLIKGPRYNVIVGDATDSKILKSLPVRIDVVIDDGSHRLGDQKKSFEFIWPLVRPGGVYCIEDLNESSRDALYAFIKTKDPHAVYISDYTTRGGAGDSIMIVAIKEAKVEKGRPFLIRSPLCDMVPITVCTPLSRVSNILPMMYSIQRCDPPKMFRWIVIVDAAVSTHDFSIVKEKLEGIPWIEVIRGKTHKAFVGHPHRNEVMDLLVQRNSNGWLAFLDDDSIMHPDFFNVINPTVKDKSLIVFGQENRGGSPRLAPHMAESLGVGSVDTGMFLVSIQCLKSGYRFPLHYVGDGEFVANVVRGETPEKVGMVKVFGSYYNYLVGLEGVIGNPDAEVPARDMRAHMECMEKYAQSANVCLEIGIRYGTGSTLAFDRGFRKNKNDKSLWISVDIRDQVLEWMRPQFNNWKLVLGSSVEKGTVEKVKEVLNGSKVDLIFIDTVYTKDWLKAEINLWSELVSDKCVWLFHDIWMFGKYNPMTEAILEYGKTVTKTHRYVEITRKDHGMGALLPL